MHARITALSILPALCIPEYGRARVPHARIGVPESFCNSIGAIRSISVRREIHPPATSPLLTQLSVAVLPHTYRRLIDNSIDRYSLFLFGFRETELDDINRRILSEYIAPAIHNESNIEITGYCDIGEEDTDLSISRERAKSVTRAFKTLVPKNYIVSVNTEGVGSERPLYSKDLPEGRFYNRTVQIMLIYPSIEKDRLE